MTHDEIPEIGDDPRRVVRLDAVHNFRDIGGYPTVDGHTTRWGRLFRADGLYRLTSSDLEVVRQLGLRTVIDLRTEEELDLSGRFPLQYHPVHFHHLPVQDVLWTQMPDIDVTDRDPAEFLEWAYLHMLSECSDRFARVIDHLAEAEVLPAVFHCAAGKDRTGVLAMLILGALGVREEYIVADYALTAGGMERMRDWSRRDAPELYERLANLPSVFTAAVPEAIFAVMGVINERHGSIRDYVLHLGVSTDALDRLSAELLD